jgi:hypothetical protein
MTSREHDASLKQIIKTAAQNSKLGTVAFDVHEKGRKLKVEL